MKKGAHQKQISCKTGKKLASTLQKLSLLQMGGSSIKSTKSIDDDGVHQKQRT